MTRPTAALFAATMMTPVGALAAGPHGYGGDVARFGSCTGVLVRIPPDQPGVPPSYEIAGDQMTGTCNIDSADEAKVLRVCAVSRSCKITGKMNDCEGADCVEFLKITAVKKN